MASRADGSRFSVIQGGGSSTEVVFEVDRGGEWGWTMSTGFRMLVVRRR